MGFARHRQRGQFAHASLNLTPMIDMMTILLVFLIKNYSTTPSYITPTQGIVLSQTTSDASAPDKPALIVGRDGVILDGETLISFVDGIPPKSFIKEKVLPELLDALNIRKQADENFSGTLILQADKGVSYQTIKPILRTAGVAGYHDIKFAGVYSQ